MKKGPMDKGVLLDAAEGPNAGIRDLLRMGLERGACPRGTPACT